LRLLCQSDTLLMDGNFAMAPRLFLQLYILHVPLGETAVPVVYAFMENKTQDSYEELLNAVVAAAEATTETSPNPGLVITVFETAAVNSARAVFGEDVTTRGCYFHFRQSTWRKIQELSLVSLYMESDVFRLFVGMMNGLAFLPLDDIARGIEFLRTTAPPEAEDLLDYFDSTYVTGTCTAPKFSPRIWNMHVATMTGDHRTDNLAEAWNRKFSSMVGHCHPTIWRAIDALQSQQASVATVMTQEMAGHPPKKKTKRIYKEMQQRLVTLCTQYVQGLRPLNDFLRGVGHMNTFSY
ncbi:unnamed protein product, partial [Ixodes hexagonus]